MISCYRRSKCTTRSFLRCREGIAMSVYICRRKDYDCNRLTSGILQLSDNTHLVIDETGLTTGQVTPAGRENYSTICDLINFQKVTYDFKYYKMEYDTDIPVLILSETKSFIPVRGNFWENKHLMKLIE